jgi:predicted dehydrogenase
VEIHGTRGTAIITGDQLTAWDVQGDAGDDAPVARSGAASGASDPMAISLVPFERQLSDFGETCKTGITPACSGVDGYYALELVRSIYESCAEGRKIELAPREFAEVWHGSMSSSGSLASSVDGSQGSNDER